MKFARLLLAFTVPLLAAAAKISWNIRTIAGGNSVGDNAPAISAALGDAQGVAVDAAGNIYLADAADHRVRRITPDGTISTVAGNGFSGSGETQLFNPYGVAVDANGNLYIADLGNNRVCRLAAGGNLATLTNEADQWRSPRNIAIDSKGNIYVSEFTGHRVRQIAPDGTVILIAGSGSSGFSGDNGPAGAARLSFPAGLAFDPAGNLYIADSGNHCIRKVASGTISTVLGTGEAGADTPAQLNLPTSVAFDTGGNMYVADSGNSRVRELTTGGVISTLGISGRDLAIDAAGNLYLAAGPHAVELTTAGVALVIAGDGSWSFRGDGGPASEARLNAPAGIAAAHPGEIYIADRGNRRIRKVDSLGAIRTVAELSSPGYLGFDSGDNLHITDTENHRLWRLDQTGALLPEAGTGEAGYSGDGSAAASAMLQAPTGLAVDAGNAVFFSDTGNHRVRMIDPSGRVRTVAGNGAAGYEGDGGPAASARLNAPTGLARGASGELYIADTGNHCIRKVDSAGQITTIADGLNSPAGLAVDPRGSLIVADTGSNRILMIGTDGAIDTIAGDGGAGFGGDGGPAASARLNAPMGLAVDLSGNILVADTGNNRIRELSPAPEAVQEQRTLAVLNSASLLPGAIAPGEIVAIFGVGIGPQSAASGALRNGVLENTVGETQVLFDGHPAALYYAQASQINAQVPYEVSGAAEVEIVYRGVSMGRITAPVAGAAPGIFTSGAGAGQAVAVNQDGSLNSGVNPAPAHSIVTFYATGAGRTAPESANGAPARAPYGLPLQPVTVTIGGYPADVLYAGSAPGLVGVMQVNARVPGGFAPAGGVPLVLRVGDVSSQAGVIISITR